MPASRYEYAEWKVARVGIDYHVEVDGHYYSVPYRFARQQVDARMTANTIEVFHRGTRLTAHARSPLKGHHTTVDDHMTPAHQAVAGWNAPRLLNWAQRIGPHVHATVEHLLDSRKHPQQSYRACLGILRLAKTFGEARLEAACARALKLNAASYRSIHSILKNGLDRQTPTTVTQPSLPFEHANVRGAEYYH